MLDGIRVGSACQRRESSASRVSGFKSASTSNSHGAAVDVAGARLAHEAVGIGQTLSVPRQANNPFAAAGRVAFPNVPAELFSLEKPRDVDARILAHQDWAFVAIRQQKATRASRSVRATLPCERTRRSAPLHTGSEIALGIP